jgi:L-ribulose-5-phosphate 3-epimerase
LEYRLGLYEKAMPNSLTLVEKLRETARAGFDFMEISIDETDERLSRLEWSCAEKKSLLEKMSETGIRIETLCLSAHRRYSLGSEDRDTAQKGMQIFSSAIGLAADLGIRIIQLAGYDVYYTASSSQTRERFLRHLQSGVEWAAARGVLLAFETMETDFMNTVSKAFDVVSRINSPFLQIYPDIGNITNAAKSAGGSPIDDFRKGHGRIAAVHLKETVPGRFREVPFGTGHVDFQGCIEEALAEGVRLFVAEFWHDGQPNWRETDDSVRRFFREKFDRLAMRRG